MIALLGAVVLHAQESEAADTGYTRRQISTTDIEVLFSYYTQDGEHSAVTGGEGTEELQVYSPEVSIVHAFDSTHRLIADFGVDVISSASTDNIDFHVSSASSLDTRGHVALGYGHTLTGTGMEFGGKGSVSIESDYFSRGLSLWGSYSDSRRFIDASVGVEAYFDDLRWGRLNEKHLLKPIKLIYPEELRFQEWEDEYTRTSLNLAASLSAPINRRMVFGIFPGIAYQYGLLSTPFHRVYFSDQLPPRVENLPDDRLKVPIGMQLNTFLGKDWVLRSGYRFYWDDFGIIGNTLSAEGILKVSPFTSIGGYGRVYSQSESDYFAPKGEHASEEKYYTSDYDLSGFTSIEIGASLRYRPFEPLFGGLECREIALRYGYYRRDDGLFAHIITTLFYVRGE